MVKHRTKTVGESIRYKHKRMEEILSTIFNWGFPLVAVVWFLKTILESVK